MSMKNIATLLQAAQHIDLEAKRQEAVAVLAAMPAMSAMSGLSVLAAVAAVPVLAGVPAMPVVAAGPVLAAGPVVAIPAANRPCEICGFIPGTKNEQRNRKWHLYRVHYRQRIDLELEATLAGSKKCPFPLCDFHGKDKNSLTRHYNDNHKISEKYLAEDINNRRMNAGGRIIASNVKCQICDQYFETKFDMDTHVAENHNV